MAKLTRQNYSTRRNTFGVPKLLADTGTAPGNLTMAGTRYEGEGDPRLVILMDDHATGARFKVHLGADEVVKLATIILGPVLADLADQARAVLAKVVK